MQRVVIVFLLLLISNALTATVIYIYKDLDDNSYYNAAISVLLEEINDALSEKELRFADRLQKFTEQQSLSYENRGKILENTREFQAAGEKLRSEK